ncbi:O-antigen ligase family protein [Halorubrum sp. ASP121]|uniref:O-antigen ligase family protein n=1 Tax=Halorubrum sp. ASP121 TaxID=1855858 RepID=UPI0034E0BE4D
MKTYYISIELTIIYLLSVLLFPRNKQRVKLFYLAIFAFVFTVCLELLYEYVIFGRLTSPHFTRYYITINRILGVAIPISVFTWFKYKDYRVRIFSVVFPTLLLFFIFQTGGRGPLIAAFISTVVYVGWVLIHKRKMISISPSFGIMTICVTLTSIVTLRMLSDHLDTLNRLQRLFVEGPGGSLLARIQMARESIRLFVDSPLFGHGIGSFQTLSASGQYTYPHNIFLEFLVESGSIGLIMFSAYILSIYLVIIWYGRDNPVYSGLILSVFTFALLNALVSGDIPSNRRLFVYSATAFSLIEID